IPTDYVEVTESGTMSKKVYNIDTNEFHKVNLVCLSPNYWGSNNRGHKHYMFMIDGCRPDSEIRTFHNENLNSELKSHRKVLDVLGSVSTISPEVEGEILSGLGFNSTVRDEIVVKVSGSHKRTLRVKF